MSTTQYSPPILSQSVKEFVRDQVAERGLHDEAEYYERLAEAEHKRKIRDFYDQKLLEALESGPPIPGGPEFWEDLKKKSKERLAARKQGESQ